MMANKNIKQRPERRYHHHHHHNGDGCMNGWERNLKRTSNKLKRVCANKDSYYDKLTNSTEWEANLNLYWDCIQKTEEMSDTVADQLELFKVHTKKVCENTRCSVKAIKIWYCYVIDLFKCIDDLKEFLMDFLKEIECIDPEINSGTSKIVACLKALCDKLDEAIGKQKEAIKAAIKVVQKAYLLHEAICSKDCGLIYNLEVLCDLFPQSSENDYYIKESYDEPSCIETIEPVPTLPLNKDMFYITTRRQHNSSKREKYRIRKKYEKWRAECEALTSCKSSLEVAITTSKEVQECKK